MAKEWLAVLSTKLYIKIFYGAHDYVMITIIGYVNSNLSSNPGLDYLHFT